MRADKNTKKQVDVVVKAILNLGEERLRDMLMRVFEVYALRFERGESHSEPSAKNEIEMYFHCRECLEELKIKALPLSPAEYAKLEVGYTKRGIQVWCRRHDQNVMHMDFEGIQHPANSGVDLTDEEGVN